MGYSSERTYRLTRRELLTLGGLSVGEKIASKLEFVTRVLTKESSSLSTQDILTKYPKINPAITSANISYIPDRVDGLYSGFHHFDTSETLFKSVPYGESSESLGKDSIYKDLQTAICRRQPTFLVIELPYPKDNGFATQCSTWEEKIMDRARFFKGVSTNFILGNELNIRLLFRLCHDKIPYRPKDSECL